jgi:septum formation protein
VGETPAEHVERLARAKAEVVAEQEPGALVVGGDTVVVLDGRVLGKPSDADEALAMLVSLAGREHEVLSGVALAWTVAAAGPDTLAAVERTAVRFRAFDEATARAYVDTGEPLDKAGAYGIQGKGAALVESIRGDYDTVVGLPVARLIELRSRAGWVYTFAGLTRRPPAHGGAQGAGAGTVDPA